MNDESPTPSAAPRPIFALNVMRVLAAIGLLDLSYLLYATVTGNPLACTSGGLFDCASALATPYAYLGPVPTSALGVLVYGLLFAVLLWLNATRSDAAKKLAWHMLAALTALAAGTACWLIAVQVMGLSSYCPYCLVTHAAGLTLTILVFRNATLPRAVLLKWMLAAVPAVIFFAGAQTLFPHKASMQVIRGDGGAVATTLPNGAKLGDGRDFDTGPGPERTIAILGGKIRYKPSQLPLIGSPDAPNILLVLYDYTCPNCRLLHQYLRKARTRYPNQFATAVLPIPLESKCNPAISETEPAHQNACELARIGLSVQLTKPEEFESFDAWMMDREETVSVADARAEAARRIGADVLEAMMKDERTAKELQKGVSLYQYIGRGAIPRLMSVAKDEKGATYTLEVRGRPGAEDELFELLESSLHMKPNKPSVPAMLKPVP